MTKNELEKYKTVLENKLAELSEALRNRDESRSKKPRMHWTKYSWQANVN